MPNSSGYNGNTDFLKWYKTHYGSDYDEGTGLVRKDGMSDGDWNVGTILQNYYIKNKQNETERAEGINAINKRYDGMIDTAVAGYDSARDRLGANKSTAQQNAAITYQKLQKYLPMQQRAEGLGGLGTESAGIDAYNKYMSQMGGIESDYQSNMTAIDESQTSHVGELERYRSESIDEKNTLHDTIAREYASDADSDSRSAWDKYLTGVKEGQDEAYNLALKSLSSSQSTSLNELLAFLSGYSGKVTDEQYKSLTEYAKSIADTNSKNATKDTESKQQAAFELAKTALASATSSSSEELLTFLAGYEGKVSPEQYEALKSYAKSIADTNSKNAADASEADQQAVFELAKDVLSSSTAVDPGALSTYISQFEGKVSPEQYAALEQYATNVAGANAKSKADADQAAAAEIAEIVINGMLDSGDYKGAQEYLANNKALLGAATVDAYQGVIESYVKESDRIAEEEKKTEHDNRITSGQESFSYNGMEYRITGAYDGNIVDKLGNSQLKTFKNAGYSGPYDPSLPNGTTIAVGTGYFTYYNGKWYKSRSLGKSMTPQNTQQKQTWVDKYNLQPEEDFVGPRLPSSSTPSVLQQGASQQSAPLTVGAPKGTTASKTILTAYGAGAAKDPAAAVGEYIGNLLSKYLFGK